MDELGWYHEATLSSLYFYRNGSFFIALPPVASRKSELGNVGGTNNADYNKCKLISYLPTAGGRNFYHDRVARDNAAYSSAEGVRAEPDAVKEADGNPTASPFGQFSAADRGRFLPYREP